MRALAAVLIFAACLFRCHAHDVPPTSYKRDTRQLLSLLGVSPDSPLHRVIKCTEIIGPSKCLAALSIWRSEKAAAIFRSNESITSNLLDDIRQFPWEQYTNSSQDDVERQLCEGTDHLLKYRPLKFTMIPGYEVELASNGNGTLNVDVLHGQQTETSRGMKKMRQAFYNIVPYLLLPGLLMSAVLPFVLPALKMMTVAVGMLNNMALSGAVFTLLRNNAFNDRYQKRIIYVNQGYRNEEKHHHHESYHPEPESSHDYDHQPYHAEPDAIYEVKHNNENDEYQGYESSQLNDIIAPQNVNSADFHFIKETPAILPSADWINQYYGNNNQKIVTFANKKMTYMKPKNN